ncbi:unnamed protein product [Moneuplotes crassus]|uniref:PIH1D1/2/3 CS-like domain-containing protein n=1 Tax=Euplotes crassus TaxID=5936 RepID=A0AAD2D4B7_EUPCR|nr:unnamed protein product [Moneuplotes crassus]
MDFGVGGMESLANLLGADREEEPEHQFGSALNPGTLDGKKKEELAKPRAKIEVKVNNRDAKGGIKEELIDESVKDEARNKERDIWTDQEVNLQSEDMPDDRAEPHYEVLHKQNVGTEDVFLGLSEKDPSSNCSDGLLMKIHLPGCKLKDIDCDVKEQSVHVQSQFHVLNHILPYPVDKENGKAQWEQKSETLRLTLPIKKKEMVEALMDSMHQNMGI